MEIPPPILDLQQTLPTTGETIQNKDTTLLTLHTINFQSSYRMDGK